MILLPVELSQFLVTDASIGDTVNRIAVIARDTIQSTAFVGTPMLDEHGMPTTAVFTDETSPEIDRRPKRRWT